MDSFEFNKIAAAILIALLTIKGADLISEALISPALLEKNAFNIEGVSQAPGTSGISEKAKGPEPIEPLLAHANVEQGEVVFKKCSSCHTIDAGGPNRIGPNLHNIVGAKKAAHPGYAYSPAMESKGGTWTYHDLNVYLYNPRHFVPGTKMSFVGIRDDQERADVIAYLKKKTENPPPVPKVEPKTEEPSIDQAPDSSADKDETKDEMEMQKDPKFEKPDQQGPKQDKKEKARESA